MMEMTYTVEESCESEYQDSRDWATIKMPERGIACEIRDKSERYKSGEWGEEVRARERASEPRQERERKTSQRKKTNPVR